MRLNKFFFQNLSAKSLLGIFLAAYLLFAYLPLLLNAGISVDDWGDISHNLDCNSFWACYQSWFPLFSNRPLAPLPITVLTFALGTWYAGYLWINSLIYLLAIAVCAKVMRHLLTTSQAITFVLFAAIPMIAMPVITSPINQSTATVSFVLWAYSFAALFHYLQSGKRVSWLLSYFLLLMAFFTYEVILPLLVLSAFLPWIWDSRTFPVFKPRYWGQFFLPLIAVLAIIWLWQKGIAPQLMDVDSRLKFSASQALIKLYTFVDVFIRQIPQLFLRLPSFLQWHHLVFALLATITLVLTYALTPRLQKSSHLSATSNAFNLSDASNNPIQRSRRFLVIAALCFAASSFIFILSNESAVSGGYQARGLSSTWFAFAILLAAISPTHSALLTIWRTLIIIFFGLCALSFSVQRDQTIAAWQLQLQIVQDANRLIQEQGLPPKSVVMGDVPHYLEPNYNQEIVFSQPWDFGAALAITNSNQIAPGPVIDSVRGKMRQLRLENDQVVALNFGGASLEQFWIYQFDSQVQRGNLTRITTPDQFARLLTALQERHVTTKR
jgi:hypothetical protein